MHSFKTESKTERLHFLAVSITQMPQNYSNVTKLLKYLKTIQMSHNYSKSPKTTQMPQKPQNWHFFTLLHFVRAGHTYLQSMQHSPVTSHQWQVTGPRLTFSPSPSSFSLLARENILSLTAFHRLRTPPGSATAAALFSTMASALSWSTHTAHLQVLLRSLSFCRASLNLPND